MENLKWPKIPPQKRLKIADTWPNGRKIAEWLKLQKQGTGYQAAIFQKQFSGTIYQFAKTCKIPPVLFDIICVCCRFVQIK